MPIAITDEHQELASTVRGVLTAHKALQAARTRLESDDEPRPSYWGEMADLGWLGVHLPEAYGGSGAGLVELVVVLEELGRQVAPGSFLPTVLASAVIDQCGSDEQRRRLLPGLADGTTTAALGLGTPDLACRGTRSPATPASSSAVPPPSSCSSGWAMTSSWSNRRRPVSP